MVHVYPPAKPSHIPLSHHVYDISERLEPAGNGNFVQFLCIYRNIQLHRELNYVCYSVDQRESLQSFKGEGASVKVKTIFLGELH